MASKTLTAPGDRLRDTVEEVGIAREHCRTASAELVTVAGKDTASTSGKLTDGIAAGLVPGGQEQEQKKDTVRAQTRADEGEDSVVVATEAAALQTE